MSWFSKWLTSNTVKAILGLSQKILKIFIGKAAQTLQDLALSEVRKAEATGKDGLAKYKMAFETIRYRFPNLKETLINHAIESACLVLMAEFY